MTKISKRVSARLSNSKYVLSSVDTNQEKIAANVALKVEGLTGEMVLHVITALAAYLATNSKALNEQEQTYADEQADDPAALESRDIALDNLKACLQEVRSFIRTHAPKRLRTFGLLADPSDAQDALINYADNVAKQLTKDSTPIKGRLKMVLVPSEAGEELARLVKEFEGQVASVGKEKRELEGALVNRDRALVDWQVVYAAVGDILSGFYRIAGEIKLASQIRPTSRRIRGEAAVTENGEDLPTDAENEGEAVGEAGEEGVGGEAGASVAVGGNAGDEG